MIAFSSDMLEARQQLNAICTMLIAVGNAQAAHLGNVGSSFSRAEANSLQLVQNEGRITLHINVANAQAGRRPWRISWVLRRLHELETANAEVRVSTSRRVSATLRAQGGTRPRFVSYGLPGRGYFRLPGPVREVDIAVATLHPRTGVDRTQLAIGRTLIHELIVHAWRDILFYQPATGTRQPDADMRTSSAHSDRPHIPSRRGHHNLADAEADLIDYYYDLAKGETISFGESVHPDFARIIGVLGGVMGSRIPRLNRHRRATSEYVTEREHFLGQLRHFQAQQRHMRRLESELDYY